MKTNTAYSSGGVVPNLGAALVSVIGAAQNQAAGQNFDVGTSSSINKSNGVITLVAAPGYEPLVDVLRRAHDQAAYGKGKERHANGRPFVNQPMQDLIRLHGVGFATGQASKKSGEALGLPTKERQVAEILGAIVYLCGAVIAIESTQ